MANLTANTLTGSATATVGDTSVFQAGEYVILFASNAIPQLTRIAAIVSGTSLTLRDAAATNFTAVQGGAVRSVYSWSVEPRSVFKQNGIWTMVVGLFQQFSDAGALTELSGWAYNTNVLPTGTWTFDVNRGVVLEWAVGGWDSVSAENFSILPISFWPESRTWPQTAFTGNGAGLTNLQGATAITGIIPAANLSTNLANLNVQYVANFTNGLVLPETINATLGTIYKGTSPFIHNFTAPGTAGQNTFVGENAGNFTMSSNGLPTTYAASYNTVFGVSSLANNTTGYENTTIGSYSLENNTTGPGNTAIGYFSLENNTTGYANTASGLNSLANNTTGYANTAIGYANLETNVSLSYCTAVGNNVSATVDGVTNSTGIGNGAVITAANQVVLGNSAVAQTVINGNIQMNGGNINATNNLANMGGMTNWITSTGTRWTNGVNRALLTVSAVLTSAVATPAIMQGLVEQLGPGGSITNPFTLSIPKGVIEVLTNTCSILINPGAVVTLTDQSGAGATAAIATAILTTL